MDSVRRPCCSTVIVGLLLVVALAACGSDDDPGASSSSSTATSTPGSSLDGSRWVLSDRTDLPVPAAGVTVTAEFADSRISGTSGCNTYRGPYRSTGSRLTIGPDLAGSKMACEPAAMAVEAEYLARLPRVSHFEMQGRTLTLLDGDTALLVYDASDSSDAGSIVGSWTAINYFAGTAVQSVIVGSTLTADFDAGQVSGDGGCNSFSGPYELDGAGITLGPFSSTLRACVDPAQQTQEQQYLAALELATAFRVTGDQLELQRADGGIAATFARTPATG